MGLKNVLRPWRDIDAGRFSGSLGRNGLSARQLVGGCGDGEPLGGAITALACGWIAGVRLRFVIALLISADLLLKIPSRPKAAAGLAPTLAIGCAWSLVARWSDRPGRIVPGAV